MSINVKWDNAEQTIILWTFIGRWSWGEYDSALTEATTLLDSVKHHVDFLYDLREMSILPPDLITQFKTRYLKKHPNTRLFLVVGIDSYLQLLWNTFTALPYARHLRARYFDSLDDARLFSKKYSTGQLSA